LQQTAVLDQLRAEGHEVRDEDVVRLSRYSFNVPEEVQREELRQLRDPNEDLNWEA
jgi:hypothetical protein